MAATVKCAIHAKRFLKVQVKCMEIASARHYSRWTHRRPAYIVENTNSQAERDRWKLKVEKEIVKYSNSETRNLEKIVASQTHGSDMKQGSYSHAFLKESRKTHQCVSDNPKSSDNGNIITNRARVHCEEYLIETVANEKEVGNSLHLTKSVLEDFSPKSEKETRKEKQPKPNKLQKLKMHTENDIKMRESAMKLGVPVFTDLGSDDTILSKFLIDVKSRKKREKREKILLEGKRLIEDALDAGVVPEVVFFSRIKDLKGLNIPDGVKLYKIIYKKLSLWSEVATSQGVLAIAKAPNVIKKRPPSVPLTVICDNVRDPGNLGTILRTCAGVGCEKVLLTKGCVDVWDPRVLRAGAGAHFRLSFSKAEDWDVLANKINNSFVCIAENKSDQNSVCHQNENLGKDPEMESDSDDDVKLHRSLWVNKEPELDMVPVVPYYSLNYASLLSVVLIVGGETEGVSSEAYDYVSKTRGVRVNIPLSNDVDSLNCSTALSIIAFEIKKQFLVTGNCSDPEVKEYIANSHNSKASVMNI